MSVGLLNGGEGSHLEHIAPDVVQPVIDPVEEGVDAVLLEQGVVVVDVGWALHRIRPPEVDLAPETLQIGVEFLKGATGLFQSSNTSPEFVDLRGITPIEICCSNSIPNCFSSGMKFPMRVGSIELINHPLTMALSVRHFRKDGSVVGGGG
jgi:hypothetical protein